MILNKLLTLSFLSFTTFIIGYIFKGTDNNKVSSQKEDNITIIFTNYPVIDRENKTEPRFYTNIPEVLYWDDDKGSDITPSGSGDTVIITTQSDYILLRHRYDVANYNEFLFKKGDSVVFNYPQGIPTPAIINRKTLDYDLKVDKTIKSELIKEKFGPWIQYEWAEVFKGSKNTATFKSVIRQKTNTLFEKEKKLVDSLYDANKVSENIRNFHNNRIYLKSQILKLKENELSAEEAAGIIKSDTPNNFPNRYLNEFIDLYVQKFIFKSSASKAPVNNYSEILNSSVFTKQQKNRLLGRQTRVIIRSSPKNIYQSHFEKFKADVQDSVLINRIYDEFHDKLAKDTQRDIINSTGENFTFQDILNRSSYTYIDFWASWCQPCRAEMPASKKLRDAFAKKGIQFVYISIDENAVMWNRATKQMDLPVAMSFLLLQGDESEIYKKFNITSIPRYAILDKKGNIIHGDALRPSDPAIEKILNELLTKSSK